MSTVEKAPKAAAKPAGQSTHLSEVMLSSLVAVDEGSSHIKVSYFSKDENGQLTIKNAIDKTDVSAGLHATSDSLGMSHKMTAVRVNGQDFSIGLGLQSGDSRLQADYQTSGHIVAMTQAALVNAGFGGRSLNIATGVPVQQFYKADGTINKELIVKKSELFVSARIANSTDENGNLVEIDDERLVTVVSNRVMPEAIGAYFDCLFTVNGQRNDNFRPQGDVLVVDIGSNTCDTALISEGGQILSQYNRSLQNQGFLRIIDMLRARLSTNALDLGDTPISILEKALLTGELRLSSGISNVSDTVNMLIDNHIKSLFERISLQVKDRLQSVDKIILVGAGAKILEPYFAKYSDVVIVPENPQYSNANGFLKMLAYNPKRDSQGRPEVKVLNDLK